MVYLLKKIVQSEDLPADKFTVAYICRYAKRPPIAESRILFYGTNPNIDTSTPNQAWVTFFYNSRLEGKITRTVKVEDFIRLLIQHILPSNFRQVRYYGILANRVRTKLMKFIPKNLRRKEEINSFQTWRNRVLSTTGKDPLLCPICGKEMKLVEVASYVGIPGFLKFYYPP